MKDIGQGAFQLELPEEWAIYNMFNEDLLTQCSEPQFKQQYMKKALPLDIINEKKNIK